MKEQLYTIPLNDAFAANDECPFCFIERKVEQDLLDFTLGSGASYMERDIREKTDQAGFCRLHFQKMFRYGNTLGNAWILKTHYQQVNDELSNEIKHFKTTKIKFTDRFRKTREINNSMSAWIASREQSCFICQQYKDMYARYLDTFFYMYKKDPSFADTCKKSKGFCLTHFSDLCEAAVVSLSPKQQDEFFAMIFPLMEEHMHRLSEDVSWLVEKFDYQNQNTDWKNSKDAIQRGMQKLKGGYPADAPYQYKK